MRIVVYVKRDVAGLVGLNYLMPRVASHEVVVLVGDFVGKRERQRQMTNKLLMVERDFLCGILCPLFDRVKTPPGTALKEGELLTFRQLRDYYPNIVAMEAIPRQKADSEEGVALLRSFEPDVILNLRNNMIYKKGVIESPKIGIFNMHSGVLPKYAGLYCLFRAMDNGDKVAGSTLHVVDEGIDTGKIIEIEPMEVDYSRSFFWNQIILYQRGIDAFIRMLGRLDDGSTVSDLATKQDANAEHNYFTLPTEDEISSFEKKGLKMYDVRELMEIAEQFHAFDIVREDAALPF